MLTTLFWLAATTILYTYVLFPVLILLKARFHPRPWKSAEIEPVVSVVIAAHNEADSIAAKLENMLELDYPRERLQILVASDGSDDGTNEIVRGFAQRGVELLELPRRGKAAALNDAVAASHGEILVFSDANSMFVSGAIRALVRPFVDQAVGGVAGNQCYLPGDESEAQAHGERGYWNFDRWLKEQESIAGNAISATGAIYAIRRELFRTVPEGVTDDFVTSTAVIAQRRRLVFAPDAIAREPVAESTGREFGRKVRIMTRGLWALVEMRELFGFREHGFYSLQLFSHKVLRRLVVHPLIILLVVSPFLWSRGLLYQLAIIGQAGFYGLALLGMLLEGRRSGNLKPFALPFYFCVVNAAAFVASLNVLRGHRITRWEPQRADTPGGLSDGRAGTPARRDGGSPSENDY